MAYAATNGVYWTGAITANTTSGQINFYAKAPSVSGVMTAYGLFLGTTNQSYSLTGANSVISVLAGSIGTGSLSFQTASNLSIGSLSGVDGFTGAGLTITETATLSQTQAISVSTLTLAGTGGVFNLSLANTISTSIALNSGTLKVSHASALGSASAPITMAANSILLSNLSTLTLSNPIVMSGAATINAPTGYTLTLSGNLTGASGALTINNPTTHTGTVILTGTNSYGSTTTLSAGTLQIGSGSTTGTLGAGSVTNNGSLIFNRSNDFTVATYSSGTGSVTKQGAGVLTFTNANRHTGGTTVDAGTLNINDAGADGHGYLVGTLTVNANGTLQLRGNSTALGWNTLRVSTLNINGGLVDAVTYQHLWNATLNFSDGGTLRTNGGTSSASATSYWEWGGVTVNVNNPTAEAVIAGRVNLRADYGAGTFAIADGVATNHLLVSASITQASTATPVR
jgi:autotransporter-associated beta strand protein